MVILQKFSSAVLRSLRVVSAILGVVIGNIALNTPVSYTHLDVYKRQDIETLLQHHDRK